MRQNELFYDTAYDAIGAGIVSCGGFKVVAGNLWPAKKHDTAYARLKSCVNEHKDEKLDIEEIIQIAKWAKEQGNHALMQYLGQELGYSVEPLDPTDQQAELQRRFVEATQLLAKIADRISPEQRSSLKVAR